jgi:hypothetical protein
MDRTMWSDERLDDRFNGIDQRFDSLERRMDRGFSEMRTELRELRQLIVMLWGPTMLGVLATIVAVVVRT